jgi:hypothetical protein
LQLREVLHAQTVARGIPGGFLSLQLPKERGID